MKGEGSKREGGVAAHRAVTYRQLLVDEEAC
jgi:hypothetical protein